ncbi:two-component system sensor histidine kinase DcuS, partial [Salmonella enterica subsp. enterica serovar Kentucky]
RVFRPVYDERHRMIGLVGIGMELSNVTHNIYNSRGIIIWSILFGSLVWLLCSYALVKFIKLILFGLDDFEISSLCEIRHALLQSIKDGVMSVDYCGEVTLIIHAAQALLDFRKTKDVAILS